MKKIAITYNTSWYIYNFRYGLINTLKDQGYQVITIAPVDKYTNKLLELGCKHFHYNLDRKGSNIFEEFNVILQYLKIYKETKPDVILHFTVKPNIYGSIAAGILKIPSINNITGLATLFIRKNILTEISKFLYIISQKFATRVFFQNSDDLELFTKDLKLVNRKKADLLPGSGVNLEKFKPDMRNENNNKFIFLLIGRMLWDKGIKEYIEAAQIIINRGYSAEFNLLGPLDYENVSGINIEIINEWERQETVKYLGATEDVRKHINHSTCVVLPSYREGTPRTLLEAAAMAKPIITTDTIGCKDVVEDKITGFLCKLKDPKDLADKMEIMINMKKEDRINMGIKGREKMVKEFDEKIVIDKYLKTIDDIIKKQLLNRR